MPIKYRTGKKPPRPGAIRYKFADIRSMLPDIKPPMVFGRTSLIWNTHPAEPWGLLSNDKLNCCVVSGGEHETMLLCALGRKPIPLFNTSTTVPDYSAVSDYVPNDASTDNGTDLARAMAYRKKTGLIDAAGVRHKIDGYMSLQPGNIEELVLAAYLFGVAGVGADLPRNAEEQFDNQQPWTLTSNGGHDGGHYFPIVARNHNAELIGITWGRDQGIKDAWLADRMDEGVAILSFEALDEKFTYRGYAKEELQAMFGMFGS